MAIIPPLEKSLVVPDYPIFRLTVEQYHAMIKAGILTDDDPVELLEGWLVTKMPQNPPHLTITQHTHDVLRRIIPPGWFTNVQGPITTADSEPEPDIVVVRGSRLDYMERLPTSSDIALVIEVSDTTLHRDRTLKLRVYASARIAIYWILNLPERQLEAYSQPEAAAYRQQRVYTEAEAVPVVIDGQEVGRIAVRDLLP
jgi:Uma2 family endonuclease